MKSEEIAWVAGLLEGEGCFDYNGSKKKYPKIRMETTDRDIAERLHGLLGGKLYAKKAKTSRHRDSYVVQVCRVDEVKPTLEAIRPWMGERRGAKVDSLLDCF